MNVTEAADDAVRRIPEKMAYANIQSALDNLKQGNALRALAVFAEAFRNGIDLPPEHIAGVMIEVARALIWAFEFDRQSPAAYLFFAQQRRKPPKSLLNYWNSRIFLPETKIPRRERSLSCWPMRARCRLLAGMTKPLVFWPSSLKSRPTSER